MGLFSKLKGSDSNAAEAEVQPECPHVSLTPHWDNIEDMGHNDRATSFECEGCGRSFNQAEERALRDSEAERVLSGLENAERAA